MTYTISDGSRFRITGEVTVEAVIDNARGMNISRAERQGDGSMALGFAGIPGRTYQIQTSENLTEWTTRATVTADERGVFRFIDLPPLPPQRYYRSIQP